MGQESGGVGKEDVLHVCVRGCEGKAEYVVVLCCVHGCGCVRGESERKKMLLCCVGL